MKWKRFRLRRMFPVKKKKLLAERADLFTGFPSMDQMTRQLRKRKPHLKTRRKMRMFAVIIPGRVLNQRRSSAIGKRFIQNFAVFKIFPDRQFPAFSKSRASITAMSISQKKSALLILRIRNILRINRFAPLRSLFENNPTGEIGQFSFWQKEIHRRKIPRNNFISFLRISGNRIKIDCIKLPENFSSDDLFE